MGNYSDFYGVERDILDAITAYKIAIAPPDDAEEDLSQIFECNEKSKS